MLPTSLVSVPVCKVPATDDPGHPKRRVLGRRARWAERQRQRAAETNSVDSEFPLLSRSLSLERLPIQNSPLLSSQLSSERHNVSGTSHGAVDATVGAVDVVQNAESCYPFSPPRNVFPYFHDSQSVSGRSASPADELAESETHDEELLERQRELRRVDDFGRDHAQREWTARYVRVVERDEEGDVIPDGAFSSSAGDDVGKLEDLDGHDSELEEPEVKDMLERGFELCSAGEFDSKQVRFEDRVEGIPCAGEPVDVPDEAVGCARAETYEPKPNSAGDLRNAHRSAYLEATIGAAQVAVLKELGVYDAVLDALPMAEATCNIMTSEDPAAVALDDWVETDILLTLDSGCCDHICDLGDAPGYAHVLEPSPGSQRGQRFVVGNGDRVKNQGQVRLRMKSTDAVGSLMSSTFQIAEITRPLMSVSKICDQDMKCIFEKTHALIVAPNGSTVARFERDGGLYTCTMKLRKPQLDKGSTPGFARPVP